jgi:predicted transcriptional regulator
MVGKDKKGPQPMLEVKEGRAPRAQDDPTTAQYVDRMEREGRPITLRIDDRPPLVIEDARAYQMLWELIDRIETIEGVREGLRQMERGEGRPLEEVVEDIRKKHRVPRVE